MSVLNRHRRLALASGLAVASLIGIAAATPAGATLGLRSHATRAQVSESQSRTSLLDRVRARVEQETPAQAEGAAAATSPTSQPVVAAAATPTPVAAPVDTSTWSMQRRIDEALLANRRPGTNVAMRPQHDQAFAGGDQRIVSDVPRTRLIGTPNAGVVPVVGDHTARSDSGAYVEYETRMNDRIVDLMVKSPAVGGYAPVRVLLPPSYGTDPNRTYPVLYLLHGGNDKSDYQCWSLYTNIVERTKNSEALIVMPSLGTAGWATDFWNYGRGAAGGKQYGTWVSKELPQLLQRGYRANDTAAVGGISSGAQSSLILAKENPGQYEMAMSLSGLADTQIDFIATTIEIGPVSQFRLPFEMWGSRSQNPQLWNTKNPANNPELVGDTKIYVSAGDGLLGDGTYEPLEPLVRQASESYVAKAQAAGVDITTNFYSPGIHNWPSWDPIITGLWPTIAAELGVTP